MPGSSGAAATSAATPAFSEPPHAPRHRARRRCRRRHARATLPAPPRLDRPPPQISRALLGDDSRLRLPRFMEEEAPKDPEATKQELIDKIAQVLARSLIRLRRGWQPECGRSGIGGQRAWSRGEGPPPRPWAGACILGVAGAAALRVAGSLLRSRQRVTPILRGIAGCGGGCQRQAQMRLDCWMSL
jgi:hypothetical protein